MIEPGIHTSIGDATDAVALRQHYKLDKDTPIIIAHITNNVGAWGAGFTGALDRRFGTGPRSHYMTYGGMLGTVELIACHGDVFVANMTAQDGVGTDRRRVEYEELRECLTKTFRMSFDLEDSVVMMPQIGSGLGGGDWNVIFQIIDDVFRAVDPKMERLMICIRSFA